MSTRTSSDDNIGTKPVVAIHWFRKGLRIHDNPALMHALKLANKNENDANKGKIYPLYIVDPNSYQLLRCSVLRAKFLLHTLQDLNANIAKASGGTCRLYVAVGDPIEVLPELWKRWGGDAEVFMTHEADETGEPYAHSRDTTIHSLAKECGVAVTQFYQETLRPLGDVPGGYVRNVGGAECVSSVPATMSGFQNLIGRMDGGRVEMPLDAPTKGDFPLCSSKEGNGKDGKDANGEDLTKFQPLKHAWDIPWPRGYSRDEIGPVWNRKDVRETEMSPVAKGGETEALERLKRVIEDRPDWTASFEKPKTSCTSLTPSTTALSPHFSLGCLSPRTAWHAITKATKQASPKTNRSKPPVSLHGQLLWRDFNNLMAHSANWQCRANAQVANEKGGDVGDDLCGWHTMKNNPYCRTIPWSTKTPDHLQSWTTARTGYPWIDACLAQLHTEGWIHHLGRHAVACFLTRGDLWQSWEKGAEHFEGHLLDADYALNNFNWMWLSCSGFFYQYFRCYSPIAFQKKNDPNGNYIRQYVPVLREVPSKYIYEPWKAPVGILKSAGVKLGDNYPRPIVDHGVVSKENMEKMSLAYDLYKEEEAKKKKAGKGAGGGGGCEKKSAANGRDGGGKEPPRKKAKKQMKLK